ncbi:MAG TPA: hypothetical protein PK235_00905 [Phycisphaerae bacterium]|nr:hypothetical protein [Phycisphaerae bacterium]HPP19359.1 hypothetical protein [Phycisphaerae bacterium]HQE42108.1 hypothetical protein [Phycisphaerae bacterium]
MRLAKYIAALLPAICLYGCTGYRLPAGYVKVEPTYDVQFRAVSAEGSALTYRIEENPENGNLAFWEKAATNRLVEVRGYQLTDRQEVRNEHGTPGVEMTFDYSQIGIDYVYLLTMFVRGDRVHVFEAAGPRETFTPDLPAIRKAIAEWPL